MRRLRKTQSARSDLLDIWLSIATHDPIAADRMFDRLEKRIATLAEWPMIGIACPSVAPGARMLVEPPYVILYRQRDDDVQIVRVLHGARDITGRLLTAGLE